MEKKKEYQYPPYSYPQLLFKGLFFYEWVVVVLLATFPFLLFRFTGLLFSCFVCPAVYMMLKHDARNRVTLYQQFILTLRLVMEDKYIIAEPRKEEEAETVNRKKVRKQKWKKPKKANIQSYFPFKKIDEGYITMENGSIYFFFKIHSNSLDLMSENDMENLIMSFTNDLNKNKREIEFFIQDGQFSLKKNISILQKAKTALQKIPFMVRLASAYEEFLESKMLHTNTKDYYLSVKFDEKEIRDDSNIEDIQSRIIKIFSNLNCSIPTRNELKQMLAVFANRIFADNLPDTEEKFTEVEEEYLLKKKKKSYEYTQTPGIYNFKDMIVPVTISYNSKQMRIGMNYAKIYAIKSFQGSTKDTNLLSKISSIKGVTTHIYAEILKSSQYRQSLKKDLNAKSATIEDAVDMIDAKIEMDSSKNAYTRIRQTNQKMYYLSVYFMLIAKDQKELEKLDEEFLDAVEDVSITIDPLESMQKDAYRSVNPLGSNLLGKWIKQNIPSESFANLYPFNEPSLLDPTGQYIGTIHNKTDIVMFDPFSYRGNQNITIMGRSGEGKTTAIMKIIENEIFQGTYVRNIDFQGTYVPFFEKIGGINIDVAGNNEFAINPLQIRMKDEFKRGIVSDYVSECRAWISVYKPNWIEDQLDLFERYLKKAYTIKGFTDDLTSLKGFKNTDYPLLSDVRKLIMEDYKKAAEEKNISARILELMETMILNLESIDEGGSDAKLFNRYTYLGDIENIQAINFNMRDIMGSFVNRQIAQWTNIFTYAAQLVLSNTDRSKRILFAMDELQKILKKQYLPILDIISDWERVFRKFLAGFLKASQTLEEYDSEDKEIRDKVKPLLSQSTYKFIFHLGEMDYQIAKSLLNLTDTEIDQIKVSRIGSCLFKINQQVFDLDVDMPEWYRTVKADA